MRQTTLILALFATLLSYAQSNTGSIVGKLTDKEFDNEPLAFANVLIKGTTKGTTSDFDGLYAFEGLEPGSYTLVFSFVGYETQEVEATVEPGKVTEVHIVMGASAASLDEVIITTTTKRESETALLLEQKEAVTIKQSIGAQELSRKGVSDAESAVTKVSGVSKSQGSKNVFVRGLGDRYNATSLNGLPLPSEDPEYKNIALDFFSSDIIESVGINKVFDGQLYGNVGGADIDIVSKEMTGKSIFELGLGTGYNGNVLGASFLSPDGANRLGTGISVDNPISDLTQYTFSDGLDPTGRNNTANYSGTLTGGKRFDIGENGNTLSAFVTISGSNDYLYKEGSINQFNSAGDNSTYMDSSISEFSTSQLGLLNLKYRFGENNSIALNSGVIRKVTQSVGEYFGESSSVSDDEGIQDYIRRQQTNKNNLYVNQLLTSFKLSEKLKLDVDGSYNFIKSYEPDRRTNSFIKKIEAGEDFFRVAVGSAGLNHRFYSNLDENDISAKGALTYKLNTNDDEESNSAITVGGNYRNTQRDFIFRQYNFNFGQQEIVDINNLDALFNQENINNGTFEMVTDRGRADLPNALDPFSYTGDRSLYAGYAQGIFDLSTNLTLSAGIRFENVNQEVAWDTSLSSSVNDPTTPNALIEDSFLLPSASVKYNFNENSIIRLAGSKTYILPQYKEVAPFLYQDVNFASFGNPFLKSSEVYNADIKYDYFFSSGELVSVTGFYKSVKDPINRVRVNSAANELSYVNVGDAMVAGFELEFRKNIFNKEISDDELSKMMFGLNFSYLHSNQKLIDVDSDELTVRFTNDEDKLEGAAPILWNADLTYNIKKNGIDLTSSLVGNYFSDKIYSLGTAGNSNFVEQSRITLDFINKLKLSEHFGLSLKLKNLLNPDFQITQKVLGEELPVSTYKAGVTGSLGLTYKF